MPTKTTEVKKEVKEEVKAAVAEVKEEVKKEAAPKKAPAAKKEAAPKKAPAAKKEAAPKKAPAAKKEAAPKKATAQSVETFIQFAGNEASTADVLAKVKAAYVAEGHKEATIKEVKLYIKPEEGAAYYVINDKASGAVSLF